MCVCVCVYMCVCVHTPTHAHTHTHMYVCMYVCVFVCVYLYRCTQTHKTTTTTRSHSVIPVTRSLRRSKCEPHLFIHSIKSVCTTKRFCKIFVGVLDSAFLQLVTLARLRLLTFRSPQTPCNRDYTMTSCCCCCFMCLCASV